MIDCAASHSTVSSLDHILNRTKVLEKDVLFTVTNSGNISFKERGDLNFLPIKPYVNTKSVANILAFHELNSIQNAHVQYDGSKEDAFFLVFNSGRIVKFIRCKIGLYFYDTKNTDNHEFKINDVSFLQQRKEIEAMMTKKEIVKAEKVRYYQELLGWPATKDLKSIFEIGVKNADVHSSDVDRAVELGEPEAIPKGKMIRKHPTPHRTREKRITDPRINGKTVDVYIDIMYAGKCMFLITKAGKAQHHQSEYIKTRKMDLVTKILKRHLDYYRKRGLIISGIHCDNEFDNDETREIIGDAVLHIYAKDEHVHIVERQLRTIKERLRCTIYGLPYKRFPKLMVIGGVAHVTEMLNRFPAVEKGFSDTVSPAELIDGLDRLNLNKKQIQFGGYAQIWGGTTNTLKERSIGAIALNRSNENNGWYFMALRTGRVWNTNQFLENPITNHIIDRIENMSKQQSCKTDFETPSILPYELHEDKNDENNSENLNNDDSDNDFVDDEIDEISNDSDSASLLQEVNIEEESSDNGDVVKVSDDETIDNNEDDMMSLVSTSEQQNNIFDFGSDIISSESEIKEDDTPKQNSDKNKRILCRA